MPNQQDLPRLTLRQILIRADQHHEQTGSWPTDASERLAAMNGERWPAIDATLRVGNRGLPGGDFLPRLLTRKRGARNIQALPQLTIRQILAWADDHQRRTGAWPAKDGGAVLAEPSENCLSVDNGLRLGLRGLSGGDSLEFAYDIREKRLGEDVREFRRLLRPRESARPPEVSLRLTGLAGLL